MSRETTRLKGQLIGKGTKRFKEEETVSKEKSDDEEESRAGAIKKKARVDPFGEGKKKNKNKKVAEAVIIPAIPDTEKSEQDEVIGMIVEDVEEGTSLAPSTPPRKKRKRKTSTEDPTEDGLPPQAPNEVMEQSECFNSSSSYNLLTSSTATPLSPKTLKIVDISLIETPIILSRFQRSSQSEDMLKQPLLNLVPQSDDDSDEPSKVESPVDGGSPKKKRKRRKKKKNPQAATVTDA